MQYEVRAAAVEAEPVTLAGQKMQAVAVAGRAHLVPADVFEVFFAAAAASAPVKPEPVPAARPKPKPVVKRAAAPTPEGSAPKPGGPVARSIEIRAKLAELLRDRPLTTAEIGDHLYPGQRNAKLRGQAAWAATKAAAEAGLIEKRDFKWHLK